jgi:hypothetical protein
MISFVLVWSGVQLRPTAVTASSTVLVSDAIEFVKTGVSAVPGFMRSW